MPTHPDRATFGSVGLPDVAQSVRLLLILDSRSPAGAHNHSGGMEAAVTAGFVDDIQDVRAYCRGRLRTSGRVAAGFAAAACRAWLDGAPATRWQELDAELSARMPSEAVRAASRTTGSGLRRLLRATVPDDLATLGERPHHALVLGAACALTGGSPQIAARAAALATCTAPASAAIRLLGLDPYAVHGVIAGLAPEIEAIADSCHTSGDGSRAGGMTSLNGDGLPADSAPALDLLADVHATQEVRLFAS
jgi:urease accessory protein